MSFVDALRNRNDRHLLVDHCLDEGLPLASCPITITQIYAGMRPHEEKPKRAFTRSLLFFATDDFAETPVLRLICRQTNIGRQVIG